MRWVVRGLVALAALLAVALLLLALLLPRFVRSDEARARLTEAAEEATGRHFSYEEIDAGLLPPRVEIRGVALGDPGEEAARAERAALRVALLPLLRRTVLLDSLVVEGADVRLERTPHGVQLPGTPLGREPREPGGEAREEETGGGAGLAFAVRTAELSGARVALDDPAGDDLSVGPVDVRVRFSGSPSAPVGEVTVELAGGELVYGETLRKPAGVPARLAGTATPEAGGWRVDDLQLELASLRARGTAQTEPPTLRLDAPGFALPDLLALLPGLAEAGVAGRASLEGLTLGLEPPALAGRILLEPLELGDFEGQPLVLRGALRGEGEALVSEELLATLAGQQAPVRLAVRDLFGAPRAVLEAQLEDADSAALLGALAGRGDLLSGPLDATAHLEALPTAPEPLLRTLSGTLRLSIAPGRIAGVSPLRGVVDAAGPLGSAALAAGRVSGSEKVQRFYEDEFESLSGSFDVAAGTARTDDLRLVYRAYELDLRGSLGLLDLALDMTGRLTLEPEADAALAGEDEGGRRRVIQLARVTGTLDSPKIALSREAVAMLASLYANERRREKWERKLDERLGEGAGRQMLDLLDQVLQGGEGGGGDEAAEPR